MFKNNSFPYAFDQIFEGKKFENATEKLWQMILGNLKKHIKVLVALFEKLFEDFSKFEKSS